MPLKKNSTKCIAPELQEAKLKELRSSLGILSGSIAAFCNDACLIRYLRANNWSQKKARKMLTETIKWRLQYRPETIKWEDVAKEAETGKVYRANFFDRDGRPVLVMRPAVQNTNQMEGQIKYLVYCMENAILNLPAGQEQMVWLVDFEGWSMSNIPVMTARETANVLQNQYPERLAYAILYNPPKIFETFWNVVKPFLDPKTQKKVKFVYTKDEGCGKLMEELFDLDLLESAFGGRSNLSFDKEKYAANMKEDDARKMSCQNLAALSLNSNGVTSVQTACCNGNVAACN